jgi:hypothetical protein
MVSSRPIMQVQSITDAGDFGHSFGHTLDADWGHQGPPTATPPERRPCSGLLRPISASLQDGSDPFTSALLCRLSYSGVSV